MGLAGGRKASLAQTFAEVARRVLLHPFNIAIALGVLAAWAQWRPPVALDKMLVWMQGAAAPSALAVTTPDVWRSAPLRESCVRSGGTSRPAVLPDWLR